MAQIAGDGVSLFWTSIILLVVAWLTVLTRTVVRLWKKNWGWDDGLMILGIVIYSVTATLCILCSGKYGSGQKASALSAKQIATGTKLFFIAEFFYAAGAAIIKCSISVTLLRIADTRRRFVWSIWAIILGTVASAIIFNVTIANICHPIETLWGGSTTGTCNAKLNTDISLFFSAMEITTDWSLAILPAILLWKLQMKTRVKISVALILGLAAFASCATIVRLRYLSLYSDPSEFMYSTGKIGLWSIIEEGIGITAGSLHALKPLISLPIFSRGSGANSNGPNSASNFGPSRSRRPALPSDVKMETFQPLEDADGDGDSQKGILKSGEGEILKETHVSVTAERLTASPGDWKRNQVLGWKQNKFSPSTE